MRKALALAVLCVGVVVALGGTKASALDAPSATCGGAPVATGVDGSSSAAVCVAGVGAATVASKGGTDGYAVIDGDNDNPLTAASQCLDGHIALQVVGGSPSVAADDGEITDPATGVTTDEAYAYPAAPGDPIDPTVC